MTDNKCLEVKKPSRPTCSCECTMSTCEASAALRFCPFLAKLNYWSVTCQSSVGMQMRPGLIYQLNTVSDPWSFPTVFLMGCNVCVCFFSFFLLPLLFRVALRTVEIRTSTAHIDPRLSSLRPVAISLCESSLTKKKIYIYIYIYKYIK